MKTQSGALASKPEGGGIVQEITRIKNTFTDFTIHSKRSTVMQYAQAVKRTLAGVAVVLFAMVVTTGAVFGQDLILNGNIVNGGTITVARNVQNNSGGAVAVSGTGSIRLRGTVGAITAHSIQGDGSVSFTNLYFRDNRPTTFAVNVTVLDDLRVGFSGNGYTAGGSGLDIGANTLTLGAAANNGASSYDGASTAALTFSAGTVAYASGNAQSVLNTAGGVTYGTLALSNGGAKNFTTGGTVAAATFTQAGGQLSVNESVDVTTSTTLADLGSISAGETFRLTAAATGGTITAMNNGSTGTLQNAGTGTLTVTTLSGNAGVIDQTGGTTGTVAFTNNITNTGTIRTSSTGTINFNGTGTQTNTGGTISATGAGFVEFAGDIATNPGTLSFNAASTTTYDGGAQAIASTGVTYGNLVAGGSAAKTAADDFTVASNLTLTQNIAMAASQVLTMTSTTAANVSGAGEVTGSVRRLHDFTTANNYRFNRANVYLSTATQAGTDVTLTMTPATNPTNQPTDSLVARQYGLSFATLGNVEAAQLYYDNAEDNAIFYDAKIGVRTYNGATWSKLFAVGYTRTSGTNLVTVSGLNNSLAGMTELGLFKIYYGTTANNNDLSVAGNWDENSFPDGTDDVIVNHTGVTTGARALSTGSLTVNAGMDLTVNTATFPLTAAYGSSIAGSLSLTNEDANVGPLSVTGAGTLSASSGRTLTGTTWTNNTSGTSTFAGNVSFTSLTNTAGTLNFNGSGSTISGAVSNDGVFSISGTLSLATGGVQTITSNGNITVNGATGILNVGTTGVASNLTMAGTSTLAINNATGELNVFGSLELGATTTLSNDGTITVGE